MWKRRYFLLSLFWLMVFTAGAQPLWNSRRMSGDKLVLQDIKEKNKYYLAPRKLELKKDAEGKPVFQLISMRYTGTQLTGDKAEKRFSNLLQFSVTLPAYSAQDLKNIASELKLPAAAQLVPISLRNMEAILVSGVGSGMADGTLHKRAAAQSETNDGKSVLWSERSFTIALENYEAQILQDQYKNGRIAVSLNYTFFADVLNIVEEEMSLQGDSVFVETMKNAVGELQRDTLESLEAIRSDALDITIDVSQYPNALKQIDINENSVPPAYPSLEVKCFDFSYDIRPDLAYKRVFLEATSVNGQPVQEKIKFTTGARDITTQYVAFRYAVRMDKPIRYKIIEGGINGEESEGNWVQMPQFSNLVDASTQQKKDLVASHCADVEIQPESFGDGKLQQISAHFVFEINRKTYIRRLDFSKNEALPLKTLCITHDLHKPVKYFVLREYSDGRKSKGLVKNLPGDGYVLVPK